MVVMEDVDLGLKTPAFLLFTIVEKFLVVIGYVCICPITADLTTITHVTMVYCCVYLLLVVMFKKVLMKMKEVVVLLML